uniref:Uncharacterized protein n=1 Tax=Knipowitschia caucasica TaxID=637954 RepID=A0AAV2KR83_KNICA
MGGVWVVDGWFDGEGGFGFWEWWGGWGLVFFMRYVEVVRGCERGGGLLWNGVWLWFVLVGGDGLGGGRVSLLWSVFGVGGEVWVFSGLWGLGYGVLGFGGGGVVWV